MKLSDLWNIVAPITSLVAVVVASGLAYRRSTKEKLSDLRRQAYGAILSELAAVERICAVADEFIMEDELRYFHSDESRTHNDKIAEHMGAARQRYTDDYLVLSEQFIALFERFLTELAASSQNDLPPDEHDHFVRAVRQNRPQLLVQARSEMPRHKSLAERLRLRAAGGSRG
jgi:hypothetical protein